MNETTLPRLEVNDVDVDPDAVIDALQTVIADVDAFVADWFQRLDESVTLQKTTGDADQELRRRVDEYEQQKRKWESLRKDQTLEIEQKANQLTQAWLRLEDEQRRFLQMKESQLQAPQERTVVGELVGRDAGVLSRGQSGEASQRPVEALCPSGLPRLSHRLKAQADESRTAAIRQFQQLRQEIEVSRPNSAQH